MSILDSLKLITISEWDRNAYCAADFPSYSGIYAICIFHRSPMLNQFYAVYVGSSENVGSALIWISGCVEQVLAHVAACWYGVLTVLLMLHHFASSGESVKDTSTTVPCGPTLTLLFSPSAIERIYFPASGSVWNERKTATSDSNNPAQKATDPQGELNDGIIYSNHYRLHSQGTRRFARFMMWQSFALFSLACIRIVAIARNRKTRTSGHLTF
jgi:hypothetical protein